MSQIKLDDRIIHIVVIAIASYFLLPITFAVYSFLFSFFSVDVMDAVSFFSEIFAAFLFASFWWLLFQQPMKKFIIFVPFFNVLGYEIHEYQSTTFYPLRLFMSGDWFSYIILIPVVTYFILYFFEKQSLKRSKKEES